MYFYSRVISSYVLFLFTLILILQAILHSHDFIFNIIFSLYNKFSFRSSDEKYSHYSFIFGSNIHDAMYPKINAPLIPAALALNPPRKNSDKSFLVDCLFYTVP